MRATVFGAGNIGRGLVGAVLTDSGYELNYVDANSDLVDKLARSGSYMLTTADETRTIDVASVIDAADEVAVVASVATSDLVATAVGAPILGIVAPSIANGLAANDRLQVNVIACENIHPNSSALREHVAAAGGSEAVDGAGFPDVVVDRIVPGDPGALDIVAETGFEFVIDRRSWVGPLPEKGPIVFTDDLGAYKLRKLWLVNGIHALIAWLGLVNGHDHIHDAVVDPDIRSHVDSAVEAAIAVLATRTDEFALDDLAAYAQNVLDRFENGDLMDPTRRVARNPMLKLQPEERIMAPATGAGALGLDVSGYAAGIAAALKIRDSSVAGVDDLVAALETAGWRRFLQERCELDRESELASQIGRYMSNDDEEASQVVTEEVLIENPAGLHARPAAQIVELAKSATATVHIKKGEKVADANSIMSVLALGANVGDTVTIIADGEDAGSIVADLRGIMLAKEGEG